MSDDSRRTFMKAAAAGALGSLAGCMGGGGGGGQEPTEEPDTETPSPRPTPTFSPTPGGGTTETTEATAAETETDAPDTPTPQEERTVNFMSATAAESAAVTQHFQDGLKRFQNEHPKIKVALEKVSFGDVQQKLNSSVGGGNPPDIAEGGSSAQPFFFQGKVIDHGPYIEETEGIPDQWDPVSVNSGTFRGEWWSGGGDRLIQTLFGVVPKYAKQLGFDSPEDLSTWTDWQRMIDKAEQELSDDIISYEVPGAWYDLEGPYWGGTKSFFTEGEDPWFDMSDPKNPTIKVGDNARTDAFTTMLVNQARQYSSEQAAQRADEEMASLTLTNKLVCGPGGVGNPNQFKNIDPNAKWGWDADPGGYSMPAPKLDANFGDEFGNLTGDYDVSGMEGERSGHVFALNVEKQIFNASTVKDAGWEVIKFVNMDRDFVVGLLTGPYTGVPSMRNLRQDAIDNKQPAVEGGMQNFTAQVEALNEYGPSGQFDCVGAWDLKDASPIRWDDLNKTVQQGIAGQIDPNDVPAEIRKKLQQRLGQ